MLKYIQWQFFTPTPLFDDQFLKSSYFYPYIFRFINIFYDTTLFNPFLPGLPSVFFIVLVPANLFKFNALTVFLSRFLFFE